MTECLVNGTLSRHVAVSDRGLMYGDGLFETLAVIGGQPRFWQDHMDRLRLGCEKLGIPATPQEVLLREVRTVCAGQRRCVAKIVITRGPGGRGYLPADDADTTRIVSAHPWPSGQQETFSRGIRAVTGKLKLGIQPALGGIKHLNRLEQVLASIELRQSAADTLLLLDYEDFVISTPSANLFVVSGGQMLTPRLDRCGVKGVMRARIRKAFPDRCELRRITMDMLLEADELFVCNAVRGVIPLVDVDGTSFPPGPVTLGVQQWLADLQ